MNNLYNNTIIYDGETYYDLPKVIYFPSEDYKYITLPWSENYTWDSLANTIYGDVNLKWVLLYANNILNPFTDMTEKNFRVLWLDYLSEIEVA